MKRFTVNSNVSIASYQLWIYWFSNFLHPFKVKSRIWTILASRMKYLLSRTTGSKTPQSHECLQTPWGSSGRPQYLSDISLFLSPLTTLCVNISLESFTTFRRLENTPIGQMWFLRPDCPNIFQIYRSFCQRWTLKHSHDNFFQAAYFTPYVWRTDRSSKTKLSQEEEQKYLWIKWQILILDACV